MQEEEITQQERRDLSIGNGAVIAVVSVVPLAEMGHSFSHESLTL